MNIIKLCGGLGNQIFQYAFGKAQMAKGITVLFDKSWFTSKNAQNPLRLYLLDKFKTEVPTFPKQKGMKTFSERGFDMDLLKLENFYFSGYWQYPAYSTDVLDILKDEFRVNKELYTREFLDLRQQIILDDHSVAVHVRRGDYTYLDGFPVMPIEYYQNAIKAIRGNVYVFSDDIEWCKENFKDVVYIHLNEYFDFELMRLCKHQILSRSSYGWWSAHLNSNPDKLVIVPKQQLECDVRKRIDKNKQGEFDPKEWITC